MQLDGGIILTGWTALSASDDSFALIRLNANGTPDTTFDGDGKTTLAFGTSRDRLAGVAVEADGRIVSVGYRTLGTDVKFTIARMWG